MVKVYQPGIRLEKIVAVQQQSHSEYEIKLEDTVAYEAKLIYSIRDTMKEMFGDRSITGSVDDQKLFNRCVEEACIRLLSAEGCLIRFSTETDHYSREMRRFIVKEKDSALIIDVYSTLDVKLVISKFKRFVLTHVPRSWSNVTFNDVIPRILYMIRIWNHANTYKRITMFECPINTEYTYRIEKARSLIGLPSYIDPKEIKIYERSDFNTRRGIFGEYSDVSKKRAMR